uniref:endo-1,4-beta-xylanase n=3 Tax=termite gut metagenome TaxID=433724 RepID=S0DFN2_9ZZZZ
MRQKLILCLMALFAVVSVEAKVTLPRLVSDGMVLQRDEPLKIWGWASAGETVKVTFLDGSYKTKADRKGNWCVELPAHKAGGPYTMRVNGIEIRDILIGDVWLCSGQSNMELTMDRVLDLYADEVADANYPFIRYFRVPMKYNFRNEEADLQGGRWETATPGNLPDLSAVAWFFAKELYDTYGVPIGLINTSIGGSPAEAWIGAGALKDYPHYLEAARESAAQGYIESVTKADQRAGEEWRRTMDEKDPGVGVWNREDFDDSDWASISLPGYWADKGAGQVNGSVWFRKEIGLPASLAGKAATLRMGTIVDADSTFVNGTFVGTVSYQYPPRIYTIPAGVLKEGRNNITVRVTSNAGRGGFVEEKPYELIVEGDGIDLTGDWKYRVGAGMPPAAPQTFFQYKPTGLYNGMIAPLKNYALKGFLWYQGESNAGKPNEYKGLMAALINDWRAKWNKPRMPFIYAQLPGFMKENKLPVESGWAELREAQRQTLEIPHTGMAVTIDAGEWNDIHPLNKKTVGERLALEARRVAYGESGIVSTGPMYESAIVEDGGIVLAFSSVGSGIYTNLDLAGFTIAGPDGRYVWANAAVVSGGKIRVWSDWVPEPVSVRYAWADNPVGANLRNKEGLPASPFRADVETGVITGNGTGTHGGYDWELWRDRGDVCMILKEGGAFECSWDNINNALFRTGKKFDATRTHDQLGDISLDYGCDYHPDGNSYLCVYGWSVDPLIEFYVVEAWGNWRPPGAESKGTVEIDGGTYDIYRTTRVEQPSIQGTTTFEQYWSVRTDKKTSGTVSVSEHIRAWEKMGMELGKIYEVAFCVEGYQSRGTADVYKMSFGEQANK